VGVSAVGVSAVGVSAVGVLAVGVSAVGVLSIGSHCPRVGFSQFSGLVHAATREVQLLIKQKFLQNHFERGKYIAVNAWHQHSHLNHAVRSMNSLNFSILTTTSVESIKFQSTHISEITVEPTATHETGNEWQLSSVGVPTFREPLVMTEHLCGIECADL